MPVTQAHEEGFEVCVTTMLQGARRRKRSDMAVRRMVHPGIAPITWMALFRGVAAGAPTRFPVKGAFSCQLKSRPPDRLRRKSRLWSLSCRRRSSFVLSAEALRDFEMAHKKVGKCAAALMEQT